MPSPLNQYRIKAKLSLESAGALFGVNKSTFMRWESSRVPAERVLEIERVTGVDRNELRPDLYPAPAEQAASEQASAV